jgi:hypothetical protein
MRWHAAAGQKTIIAKLASHSFGVVYPPSFWQAKKGPASA